MPDKQVVFFTKTSLGIDVESTPPGAAIAYDRAEGYIGPRYENGSVPAIAGSFATDGDLLNRRIRQIYATGHAAKTVTGSTDKTPDTPEKFDGEHSVMFFGTGTVFGLKLAFGAGGLVESFTLGYKRKELSVIPASGETYPSVFAKLDNSVETNKPDSDRLGIEQFFATGKAADALALQPDIAKAFKVQAANALAAYRDDERQQTLLALDVLYCLSRLQDNQLASVWRNAKALELFDDASIPEKLAASPPGEARTRYTGELRLIDASSKEQTRLLRAHQAYVCELATH